ncbi:MAG: carbohydrate binding domain-containing protein, partial [Clostridia bacterium]|nr:carbohydrate binding domain-containing protein [Clostridia bacterium]
MKSKMLKIFLIFILIAVMFSSFGVMAAKEKYVDAELLMNGDMELLGEARAYWTSVVIETDIIHSGERSLKQTYKEDPDNKRISIQTQIGGFVPGKAYKYTAWLYVETLFTDSKIQMQITAKDEDYKSIPNSNVTEFVSGTPGKWQQVWLDFVPPTGTVSAEVQLRLDGGGTIYWDDASIIGPATPEYKEYIENFKQLNLDVKKAGEEYLKKAEDENLRREIEEGQPNIIVNGGFEEGDDTKATRWSPSNGDWGNVGHLVTDPENVHSGKRAVMISTQETYGNPYFAHQLLDGFEPGREYVFSAWVKNVDMPALKGALIKFECYSDPNNRSSATSTGALESPIYVYNDHEWHHIKFVYRIPENTKVVLLLIRMNAPGSLAYDDVSLGKAAPESVCEINSYRKFFYTENPEGTVFAEIDNSVRAIEPGDYVEFSIKAENGNVVVFEKVQAQKITYWTFKTALLSEKKAKYIASANYYDASGNLIDGPNDMDIYKFDRLKRLNEAGHYVDPATGEIVYPALAYAIESLEDAEYAISIGCNVLKGWANYNDKDENILAVLDWAKEHGVKICQSLYTPVAGHPLSIDRVKEVVKLIKDHPALYGYMLQDEPTLHPNPAGETKTYEQMLYYMAEGYKVIREIDENNVVYCLESGGAGVRDFRTSAQCTDVFMVDPYPYGHEIVKNYQVLRMGQCLEATNGEFPQLVLLKAAAMGAKDYDQGTVTDVAVRHQAYQALWMGAHEFGYIPFESSQGYKIQTSPFAAGIEAFTNTGEQQIIRDHFHGVNTTLVSNYQGKDVWMRSWIDGKGQMYLVLMNMTTGDVDVKI